MRFGRLTGSAARFSATHLSVKTARPAKGAARDTETSEPCIFSISLMWGSLVVQPVPTGAQHRRREALAGNEHAGARLADDLAVVEHHFAAADGGLGPTGHHPPGVGGVLRVREHVLVLDG